MAPIEPSEPVVETPPREGGVDISERVLRLRIRQQQKLAELGVRALKGATLAELLDDAARLSACRAKNAFERPSCWPLMGFGER
jgi:hypothetical protein